MNALRSLGLAIAVVPLVVACTGRGDARGRADGEGTTGRDTLDTEVARTRSALDDHSIAILAKQLNVAEISAAKTAGPKLQNAGARSLAGEILADHQKMVDPLDQADPSGDTAQPPAELATLQAHAKSRASLIVAMPAGPAFDRAFVTMQVDDHRHALDSLTHWQASVRAPGLRTALGEMIPSVQKHLAHASQLLDQLGGSLDTGIVAKPAPDTVPSSSGGKRADTKTKAP